MLVYLLIALLSGFAPSEVYPAYGVSEATQPVLASDAASDLAQPVANDDHLIQMPGHGQLPAPHSPYEAEGKTEKEIEKQGGTSSPVAVSSFFARVLRSGKLWARPPTAARYVPIVTDPGTPTYLLYQVFRI